MNLPSRRMEARSSRPPVRSLWQRWTLPHNAFLSSSAGTQALNLNQCGEETERGLARDLAQGKIFAHFANARSFAPGCVRRAELKSSDTEGSTNPALGYAGARQHCGRSPLCKGQPWAVYRHC